MTLLTFVSAVKCQDVQLCADRWQDASVTKAERFLAALKKAGKSQAQAERDAGLTKGHLNRLLQGNRGKRTAHATIASLAKALNVSERWLETGEGSMEAVPDPGEARPSDPGRWRDYADGQPVFLRVLNKQRAKAEAAGHHRALIEAASDEASDQLRNFGGGELDEATALRVWREAWAWVNEEDPPTPKVHAREVPDEEKPRALGGSIKERVARVKTTRSVS